MRLATYRFYLLLAHYSSYPSFGPTDGVRASTHLDTPTAALPGGPSRVLHLGPGLAGHQLGKRGDERSSRYLRNLAAIELSETGRLGIATPMLPQVLVLNAMYLVWLSFGVPSTLLPRVVSGDPPDVGFWSVATAKPNRYHAIDPIRH